jgi:hypothetical protein
MVSIVMRPSGVSMKASKLGGGAKGSMGRVRGLLRVGLGMEWVFVKIFR